MFVDMIVAYMIVCFTCTFHLDTSSTFICLHYLLGIILQCPSYVWNEIALFSFPIFFRQFCVAWKIFVNERFDVVVKFFYNGVSATEK